MPHLTPKRRSTNVLSSLWAIPISARAKVLLALFHPSLRLKFVWVRIRPIMPQWHCSFPSTLSNRNEWIWLPWLNVFLYTFFRCLLDNSLYCIPSFTDLEVQTTAPSTNISIVTRILFAITYTSFSWRQYHNSSAKLQSSVRASQH